MRLHKSGRGRLSSTLLPAARSPGTLFPDLSQLLSAPGPPSPASGSGSEAPTCHMALSALWTPARSFLHFYSSPGSLTALPFVSPPDMSLFDLWPMGSKGKEGPPSRTGWCSLSLVTPPPPCPHSGLAELWQAAARRPVWPESTGQSAAGSRWCGARALGSG